MTPEAEKTVISKSSVVFCLARGGDLIPLWRRPCLNSGKIDPSCFCTFPPLLSSPARAQEMGEQPRLLLWKQKGGDFPKTMQLWKRRGEMQDALFLPSYCLSPEGSRLLAVPLRDCADSKQWFCSRCFFSSLTSPRDPFPQIQNKNFFPLRYQCV